MAAISLAKRQSKKQSFLKALAERGTISAAARAVRMSRDAVHDWRFNDPAFAGAFLLAKYQFRNRRSSQLADACDFFGNVVRPLMPIDLWAAIEPALKAAIRFSACAAPSPATPSRNARAPVNPRYDADRASTPGFIGTRPIFNVISDMGAA